MKKNETRRVLDKAVNALDNAHVITSGPKGDSKRAATTKRRAEDMVEGAMLGLAVARMSRYFAGTARSRSDPRARATTARRGSYAALPDLRCGKDLRAGATQASRRGEPGRGPSRGGLAQLPLVRAVGRRDAEGHVRALA